MKKTALASAEWSLALPCLNKHGLPRKDGSIHPNKCLHVNGTFTHMAKAYIQNRLMHGWVVFLVLTNHNIWPIRVLMHYSMRFC